MTSYRTTDFQSVENNATDKMSVVQPVSSHLPLA
jgi:hypothetical protein